MAWAPGGEHVFPELRLRRTALLVQLLLLSSLLWLNLRPVQAFSSGPYSHAVITQLALARYAMASGKELVSFCSESLIQGSIVSDSAQFADRETYHCDNNNIAGCSFRLDQLKASAIRTWEVNNALRRAGMALHIVQDFYAHSNWVEKYGISMVKAPISTYKDVAPPGDLQTGRFPDLHPDLAAVPACFLAPEESWSGYIHAATHSCINKDSNRTPRGASLVPHAGGRTYHELAGEYAIRHSRDLIADLVSKSAALKLHCVAPQVGPVGCNTRIIQGCSRVLR